MRLPRYGGKIFGQGKRTHSALRSARDRRSPKTEESIASLPLIDRVRVPLELWRRKSPDTSGWVFPSVNNTPIDLHNLIARVIRPALKAKGLTWKSLYAGRRGAGTAIMLEQTAMQRSVKLYSGTRT